MKLIIDIPKRIYDVIQIRSAVMKSELHQAVLNGIPLDKIRAEIEQLPTEKCTETRRIYIDADDFKENVLEIIDKHIGSKE